jgi:hypothetical protein
MTERRRLEYRRLCESYDIEVAGVAARDAGILVSLCLQHHCPVETLARAVSRNGDGSASGVVGAVLDKIIGTAS